MALRLQLIGHDLTAALRWKSLAFTEQIGQPDELTAEVEGFLDDDPGITATAVEVLANLNNYFYTSLWLDSAVLFSGLIRTISIHKNTKGAVTYVLRASGWHFLLSRRLVGVPDGNNWFISAEAAAQEGLPEPVNVDPRAEGVISAVALFYDYWRYPGPVDLTTYVDPAALLEDGISFSGTDMEGALNEIAAGVSASLVWYFANDAPGTDPDLVPTAPHLAFHWGIIVLPDEGDEGDDLLAGLPSPDPPTNAAPYDIDNDAPDGVTSIMPTHIDLTIDHQPRTDATYVRGATGYLYGEGGVVTEGGTGWVGAPGGIWGEEYTDAPAAVSSDQRDAYGNAFLASRGAAQWNGTITVVGYDGWRKGQVIRVTDADLGMAGRWFLIRGVSMKQNDPQALANEWTLTVGEALPPALGYALRDQRLREQRQAVDPGVKFVPVHSDPNPAPEEVDDIEGRFAASSGDERHIAGVGARWHLWISNAYGEPAGEVALHDPSLAFYLSDETTVTDDLGRVYAIMHPGSGIHYVDGISVEAGSVSIDVVLP